MVNKNSQIVYWNLIIPADYFVRMTTSQLPKWSADQKCEVTIVLIILADLYSYQEGHPAKAPPHPIGGLARKAAEINLKAT